MYDGAAETARMTWSQGEAIMGKLVHRPGHVAVAVALLLWTAACATAPAAKPGEPSGAPKGHLVIVGGGDIPDEVLDRFLVLAGGRDARIVVFPMASQYPDSGVELTEDFRTFGARAERVVLTREKADAEERRPGSTA